MKVASRSLTAGVIVVMSCLVWTGAISLAAVYFLKLPAATGWMIAGFLGLVATIAVIFILYGMRHATFLKDPGAPALPRADLPGNRANSGRGIPRR